MVVDDLGWHNVGWHNPDMITPNADELVASGMTCAAALRRLHSLLRLCSRGGFSPPGRFSATFRRRFTALYLDAKRRGAKQPCQKRWSACRLQLLQLRSRPIGCQSEPALLAARRLDRSYQFWYCAPTRSSIMTGRLPYHVKCAPPSTSQS